MPKQIFVSPTSALSLHIIYCLLSSTPSVGSAGGPDDGAGGGGGGGGADWGFAG